MDKPAKSRRHFLRTSVIGASAALAGPVIVTEAKTPAKSKVVGQGDHQYEVLHNWPQLPDKYTWQTTHNVAVDRQQNLYVIHEGKRELKDHPAIFVFGPDGGFLKAFGSQFQGGGHGIEVRQEGGEEFLYVCGYQQVKAFAKMTLDGDIIWWKNAPMESGVYADHEDVLKQPTWGQDRFLPTNFAFLEDGGFLLADGYGSFYIHRYDQQANWLAHFGGPGEGQGTFKTPHGIWIDRRSPADPRIVVCDRAHHTLQVLDMQGKHLKTLSGYGLPANIDTQGDLMLVPELHARVTLLDREYRVVARLGDDVQRVTTQQGIRNDSAHWLEGKFVHPHDACFGANGDIFVAEWVATGRVSKLRKLS